MVSQIDTVPEGAMFVFSPPSPAMAAAQSLLPAQVGWTGFTDDVALGCESADPALQIAMWGQETDDRGPTPAVNA